MATVAMLAAALLLPGTRPSLTDCVSIMAVTGQLSINLVVVIAGVSLISGAVVVTGLASTLAGDLVRGLNGSPALLLLVTAGTAIVLGTGMTVTSVYIFMAVTIAPALVQAGYDVVAAHFFLLYFGVLSYLTPPVAVGAFAAAKLADAPPFKTAMIAFRMALPGFAIPLAILLDPALLGRQDGQSWVIALALAVLGIGNVALWSGAQRPAEKVLSRLPGISGGLLLMLSGSGLFGLSRSGAVLLALLLVLAAWFGPLSRRLKEALR